LLTVLVRRFRPVQAGIEILPIAGDMEKLQGKYARGVDRNAAYGPFYPLNGILSKRIAPIDLLSEKSARDVYLPRHSPV